MIIRSIKLLLLVFTTSFIIAGCQKDEDIGGTSVEKLAGEWWVRLSVDGQLISQNFFPLLTYNTADNAGNKMWLDDEEAIWPFKFKVDVNAANQTFSAASAESLYSNIKVNLQNGKVLTGVSKGPVSQAVTDSIYFEAEFSDDPGTVYQIHGYARTRYVEDDH